MPNPVTSVSARSLKTYLQTPDQVVLLDFWAPWCAPCRALAPTLERLAQHSGDTLTVLKIDIDKHPDLRNQFAIRGIPTLILLRGETELARRSGSLSLQALRGWIREQGVELSSTLEPTPTPWGAFYGDAQLRDFLLTRLKQHAENEQLIVARTSTWNNDRGTLCAALVHSDSDGVFERVTGLPANLMPALDFFNITTEQQVSQVFDGLALNTDTRHVAGEWLRRWLDDAGQDWPQLLNDKPLDALRRTWLELSANHPTSDQQWQALHKAAQALGNIGGDPSRELQSYLARLLARLSPLPADSDLPAWQAVFAAVKNCSVHLLMHDLGWTAQERATPALRNQWFEQREREHGGFNAQTLQSHREQWNTENAAFLLKEQQFHADYLQNAARSQARHLQTLAALLADAPLYTPL